MIQHTGNTARISGPMTLNQASDLLSTGRACLQDGVSIFDLSAVAQVDSSAIAVILAWLRTAQSRGQTLSISQPPKELLSLAELYGVRELLPLAA